MRREVAHNLMRLIAEGTEDEETDQMLRQDAISSYLALLDKPHLPDILIKIICWVGKRLSLEAMSSSCFTQPHECHRSSKKECPTSKCCFCGDVCVLIYYLSIGINTTILENVEHCGGEPKQADTRISCHW